MVLLNMDDDEFVQAYRDAGWSEDAARMELAELHDYRDRFEAKAPVVVEEPDEKNELAAALGRSRRHRKARAT